MTNSSLPQSNTEKINSFLHDTQYLTLMQSSASFNMKLLKDKKLRLPFLDSQTGVAQIPSKLFSSSCDRMPGNRIGQIYRYPAQRWCRKKRSYLVMSERLVLDSEINESNTSLLEKQIFSGLTTDDSSQTGDTKALTESYEYESDLFVGEPDEGLELDDAEDDIYTTRSFPPKRKRKTGKSKFNYKNFRGSRRRRLNKSYFKIITDADDENPGKPYECTLCGARYKTRQGLSYHLSHTHHSNSTSPSIISNYGSNIKPSLIQVSSELASNSGFLPAFSSNESMYSGQVPSVSHPTAGFQPTDVFSGLSHFQDSYLDFISTSKQARSSSSDFLCSNKQDSSDGICYKETFSTCEKPIVDFSTKIQLANERIVDKSVIDFSKNSIEKHDQSLEESSSKETSKHQLRRIAIPNDYCDFCLGSKENNAKTSLPEEMISCADCGRAGHISCLQFTVNMARSVRRYRWQCIECKCCTVCGTSENDDKLLFCDTCDRGIHLYCITPPLSEPPEGEWSCYLCIEIGNIK